MSNKVLTIVVPSYNCGNLLKNTIPSFIKMKNEILNKLELIIVNDGSIDNTQEVAEEFASNYPDVIRVVNKQNGGHGSTINSGIEVATGKYFKVVDGDDYVISENLAKLINFLEQATEDLVINPYIVCYTLENRDELVEYTSLVSNKKYSYDEALTLIGRIPAMHSLTYKTSILKENDIRLFEHCFYVDLQYNVFPMSYVETISYIDIPVYLYQVGDMNQSVSAKSYLKNNKMHRRVINSLIDYRNQYADKLSIVKVNKIDALIAEISSIQINIFLSYPDIAEGRKDYDQFIDYLRTHHEYSIVHPYGTKAKLLKKAPFLFNSFAKWYQHKFLS